MAPVWSALLPLAGCVQPYNPGYGAAANYAGPPRMSLATQDQTAGIEEQDRIARFRRLASMQGVVQPNVERLMLPPGSTNFMVGPVPVVRVVFAERAFFAFNSAEPLPASQAILDVIAENMKRDVPDAAMTVLGHTDAIGTDAYNIDLSRRRAAAVIAALMARGVNAAQLSAVAIGKRQPIAPNDSSEGRALNRRVEFLISSGMSANLAAIQQRVVSSKFFETRVPEAVTLRRPSDLAPQRRASDLDVRRSPSDIAGLSPLTSAGLRPARPLDGDPIQIAPDEVVPRLPSVVEVLRPSPGTRTDTLHRFGGLPLSPASPTAVGQYPVAVAEPRSERVALAPTMPVAPVTLIPPDEIVPRTIDPSGPDNL